MIHYIKDHGEDIGTVGIGADTGNCTGLTDGKPAVYYLHIENGNYGLELGDTMYFNTFADLFAFAKLIGIRLVPEARECIPMGMEDYASSLEETYRKLISCGLDDICEPKRAQMLADSFDRWLRDAGDMAFVLVRNAAVDEYRPN